MIKEIKITNFYSFSEETIVLQPDVNILIGINGSGKSNFLKAVRLLQEGVAGIGLRKYVLNTLGGFENIYFKGEVDNSLKKSVLIKYTFDADVLKAYGYTFNDDCTYLIGLNYHQNQNNYSLFEELNAGVGKEYNLIHFSNGEGGLRDDDGKIVNYENFVEPTDLALSKVFDTNRFAQLSSLRSAIGDISIYDYFDTGNHSSIGRSIIATSDKKLSSDGANLAQILNTIKINNKQTYNKIVKMLEEINPNFSGFDFHVVGGSNIELMLDEKGLNSSVHASSISDGTLRYLCLLAILYNPERGKLICIDEPEAGLHPDMIHGVAKAIQGAAEESTIVISTHSVDLLNYFNVENLQVFEKDEYNSTKVIKYKSEQFKGWYEEFTVGKMWVSGDFGGVRYGS